MEKVLDRYALAFFKEMRHTEPDPLSPEYLTLREFLDHRIPPSMLKEFYGWFVNNASFWDKGFSTQSKLSDACGIFLSEKNEVLWEKYKVKERASELAGKADLLFRHILNPLSAQAIHDWCESALEKLPNIYGQNPGVEVRERVFNEEEISILVRSGIESLFALFSEQGIKEVKGAIVGTLKAIATEDYIRERYGDKNVLLGNESSMGMAGGNIVPVKSLFGR